MRLQHSLPLPGRPEAGHLLASDLAHLRHQPGLLVLALPRGGVPVAHAIARVLQAPLDVLPVRKLGLPHQPEFGVGALAPGDVRVMDREPRNADEAAAWDDVARQEAQELARREAVYRAGRSPRHLRGHTVILVDDGMATGACMEAAARSVRACQPERLVLAVPVASQSAAQRLAPWVDELVVGATPEPFVAVGRWYQDFRQTTDDQVLACLADPETAPIATPAPPAAQSTSQIPQTI